MEGNRCPINEDSLFGLDSLDRIADSHVARREQVCVGDAKVRKPQNASRTHPESYTDLECPQLLLLWFIKVTHGDVPQRDG